MQEKIKNGIREALKNLGIKTENISLEHPEDFKNGDYSTNVAMVYSKELKMKPVDLAEKIIAQIARLNSDNGIEGVEEIEIAGPGFINFFLAQEFFAENIKEILKQKEDFGRNELLAGKKVMVEYTQPNPFKPFHIGHLMSNAIGESISRLVEFSGAKIIRANYQGDIGLHVAKAVYILLMDSKDLYADSSVAMRAFWIGKAYTLGASAYEKNPEIKKEIDTINKKLYDKSDEKINEIYKVGLEITMQAFEELYKKLGTKFDCYFMESEMVPIGIKIVEENIEKVFEKSDGAIVFKADKYDPSLHTRVFITSLGLPTYEAKELGLTITKFEKENPDISIVITANEQQEYMKVVKKSLEMINPEIAKKMKHVVHGMLRFASGKMSSRTGNVVTGESLLNEVHTLLLKKITNRDFTKDEKWEISWEVAVAALKYSILKNAMGGDIIYDFEKSISFEGDSGPYLQYSYARASSLLERAEQEGIKISHKRPDEWETTPIEKILYKFPEVVFHSMEEFEPHYLATYLIELARTYNAYYGSTKIVDKDDPTSPYKVALTEAFSIVLKNGLYLLGIKTPEKM
jgi:arginyl-tRNA synthetase